MITAFRLEEYLVNPTGIGSVIIPNKTEIQAKYHQELAENLERYMASWYNYKNEYVICTLKVPSAFSTKLFYDVVFEIDIRDISNGYDGYSAGMLPTRVFSNSPSFVYTYAKAFDDKGFIIPWLKNRYNGKVFKNDPMKRNSYKIISYEKTIYLAALYLKKMKKLNLLNIITGTRVINSYNQIKNQITSSDEIMIIYNRLKEEQKIEKAKAKRLSSQKAKEYQALADGTDKPKGGTRGPSKPKGTRKPSGTSKPRKSR